MERKMIKVCGITTEKDMAVAASLGVDVIGLVFKPDDERYVRMMPSKSGILPDFAPDGMKNGEAHEISLAGVFADDMPQNIITRVYNYNLDYVQLDGEESAVMIDNLRRTLEPDIRPGVKIIKTLHAADMRGDMWWRCYEGVADMLRFDPGELPAELPYGQTLMELINAYAGAIPFIIGGCKCEADMQEILSLAHPMFAGIDLQCSLLSPADVLGDGTKPGLAAQVRDAWR